MSKHSLFIPPKFQFDGQGNVIYFPPHWRLRGPRQGYRMETQHRWRQTAIRISWPIFLIIFLTTLSVPGPWRSLGIGIVEVLIYLATAEALRCGMFCSELPYDDDSACRDSLRIAGKGWLWAEIAFAGAIWASSIWMLLVYGLSVAAVLLGMSSINLLWTLHAIRRLCIDAHRQ